MEWLEGTEPAHSSASMLRFEQTAYQAGFRRIAGVDEVGRGPLAGPLVAAAAILGEPVEGLNDSKLLSASRRSHLFSLLQKGPHHIAVAVVDADEVDTLGIQPANYAAMNRALNALDPSPDFALVDGFSIPGCVIPHKRIVKGDRLSLSIAAASIIAKVTRDRMMEEFDERYPEYGFARHKGYGTRRHLDALEKFGPCPIHRKSFAPLSRRLETAGLFQAGKEFS